MNPVDLREYKQQLRREAKADRLSLPAEEKARMDAGIFENVRRLWQYKRTGRIFFYLSTPMEVETRRLLRLALAEGKEVAVPRCIPGTREMRFHLILSLEAVRPGAFGVDEPPEQLPVADPADGGLMLVPALRIDRKGYRLGYGKGYYDRYVAGFAGQTVGLGYGREFVGSIRHGRFDLPVDVVVTEEKICTISQKERRI